MIEGIFDFVTKVIADNIVLVFLFSDILMRSFSIKNLKKLNHVCDNYQ